MNPRQVTDDTGQRFALITNDNHSGYLWIASILCLIYSCLVLLTRLHIKWNLYGVDDIAATVATVWLHKKRLDLSSRLTAQIVGHAARGGRSFVFGDEQWAWEIRTSPYSRATCGRWPGMCLSLMKKIF